MKKDYKLYNMIFPSVFLWIIHPLLWGISIFGNFIIDSLVLIIISLIIFKKVNFGFYKNTFLKVYIIGFFADIIGNIYLAVGCYIGVPETLSNYFDIVVRVFYISAIILSAIIIYLLNYFVTFNYSCDYKISKKHRIFASLSYAIFTAPYTFLIPDQWLNQWLNNVI